MDVAIATGMRPGELRGLKWDCVDLDRGLVTVRRTITKDGEGHEVIADRTKSKQPRTVAISPQIVDVLRWHRFRQHERQLAHDDWHAHGIVFDRGDGQFCNLTTWQRYHKKLCERADVPQIRAHDLRHSYATALMEANVHPRIVADILGHSTVQMTLDRYRHVSTSMQRAALDAIDDVIGEVG